MAKEIKKGLTYNLTYKEVVDILQIMNESTNCQELHLELEDFKLTIIRQENRPPGKPAGHTKVEPRNALFPEASGIAQVEKKEPILPEPQDPDPQRIQNTSAGDSQEGGSSGVAVKSPLVGTIPGNDDSIRSIELIASQLADAILAGKSASGDFKQEQTEGAAAAGVEAAAEPAPA